MGGGGMGGGGGGGRGGDMRRRWRPRWAARKWRPEAEPNMKSIVMQGTIYIFNPPTTGQPAADPGLAAAVE